MKINRIICVMFSHLNNQNEEVIKRKVFILKKDFSIRSPKGRITLSNMIYNIYRYENIKVYKCLEVKIE